MDQSTSAGHVGPASLSASVKSFVSTSLQARSGAGRGQPLRSVATDTQGYQIADVFGRCFLRVCYWVEVFSSFTRRGEPVHYSPFPKPPIRSALQAPVSAMSPELTTEQTGSAQAGSSGSGES